MADGCYNCSKYMLFIFNFIILVLGCGLVAVGLWLRLDPVTQRYLNSVEDMQQYYYATYAMMGCGGLMILIGFLGCCGACCESQCLLCLYFVLLLALFVMEVGGGVWAYFHREKIETIITGGLDDAMKNVYGQESSGEVVTEAIDSLQKDLKCCGAESPVDWAVSEYSKSVSALGVTWSVPESCCISATSECGKNKGLIVADIAVAITGDFYTSGCSKKFINEIQRNYVLIAGIGIGVGVVQLLGMVFALCMCCALRRGGSSKDYA